MTKAWIVSVVNDDDKGSELVWANDVTSAKQQGWELDPDSFIDLRARRCKWADGLENLDKDELFIKQLEHGWRFWDIPVFNDFDEVDWEKQAWIDLDADDVEGLRVFRFENYKYEKNKRGKFAFYKDGEWHD